MEDTAVIRPYGTVQFKQTTYQGGVAYTVPQSVANALGSDVEILSTQKASVPADKDIEQKMKDKQMTAQKNTMMAGTDKRVKKKSKK